MTRRKSNKNRRHDEFSEFNDYKEDFNVEFDNGFNNGFRADFGDDFPDEFSDEYIEDEWSFYTYLTSNAIHYFDIRKVY